ncbi:hypothetical protein H5410_001736 [Solanum commersonii]|uniref:Uncharacterized protein n=1 Tax=Solanum commersonii TaxID=4109 RepID=A0A9J6B0F6_SOLCO|nr:hypothetical protein H5410_001736 [Solanum commersonii]
MHDHHIIDIMDMKKDNTNLRAAMLKNRYANVIFKSQQEVHGEAFDGANMKKKYKLWEKKLQEEKPNSQLE